MNNPKVNVVVGGHRNEYHSTYKTYILRGGIPFADQVIMPDTKYVIKYDFDLGGGAFDLDFSNADTHTVAEVTYYYIPFTADGSKYTLMDDTLVFIDSEWNGLSAREIKPEKGTLFMLASITGGLHKNGYGINVVTVPENCILEFDGGSLDNGVIVGQDTLFINVGDVKIWGKNLIREGTWLEKQCSGCDYLRDKNYDPEHYSGLGRKTFKLKKGYNNILTQDDFAQDHILYVIPFDFNLDGNTITIPDNCILNFLEGGSISNGEIVGDNTWIEAPAYQIFGDDLVVSGSFTNGVSYPEWFGAKGDGETDDTSAIQRSIDFMESIGGGVTLFGPKEYNVTSFELKTRSGIKGAGQGATIIKSSYVPESLVNTGIVVYPINIGLAGIEDMTILGTDKGQNGITIYRKEYNGSDPLAGAWGINEVRKSIQERQAYKDSIIHNVYVGRCNYGIYCDGESYRINIVETDVKFCNYGIWFNITDSSIHECYIENCSYDGLIIDNSNNKISDIKSIWNGAANPLNCYGIKVFGNRNGITNCELQDNYGSGIYVGGTSNTLVNIMANGNGQATGAAIEAVENVDGEGLAEWVLDTDCACFSNCVASNYNNREAFPKYPILYKSFCNQIGTGIDIIAPRSIIVASHPIFPDFPIRTMPMFQVESDHIDHEKGYKIGDKTITLRVPLNETPETINMGVICEFIPAHVEAREILYSLNKFMGLYIDPPSASQVNGITFIFACGNRYPNEFPIQNIDINKPVRTSHRVTFKSFNPDGTANITSRVDFWYWNLGNKAYSHYYTIENTTYDYHEGMGVFRDFKANSLGFRRGVSYLHDCSNNNNVVYLRKLVATYDNYIPETVSYPGYPLYDLKLEYSFDHLTIRDDVGNNVAGPSSARPAFATNGSSFYDDTLDLPLKFIRGNWINPFIVPIGNVTALDEHGDPIPEQTTNANNLTPGTIGIFMIGDEYKDTYNYPFGQCYVLTLSGLADSSNYYVQVALSVGTTSQYNAKKGIMYRTKFAGTWSSWMDSLIPSQVQDNNE